MAIINEETKNIPAEELKKAMAAYDAENTGFSEIEWNGLRIAVKRTLSFDEAEGFYQGILDTCFSENDEYRPETKDFVTGVMVLTYYTNLTLPHDVEEMYRLVMGTDLLDSVMEHINAEQYWSMVDAAEEKAQTLMSLNYSRLENELSRLEESISGMEQAFSLINESVSAEEKKDTGKQADAGLEQAVSGLSIQQLERLDTIVKSMLEQKAAKEKEDVRS